MSKPPSEADLVRLGVEQLNAAKGSMAAGKVAHASMAIAYMTMAIYARLTKMEIPELDQDAPNNEGIDQA